MSRKSFQRETIRRVVMDTISHPGADWVYNEVRKEIPNISLGTVYRNLRLLAKAGEIRQLDITGSPSRFDGNNSNHYHFRCVKCGRLYDLDEPVDCSIEERVAKKTGFEVTTHYVEFVGLCSQCKNDKTEKIITRIKNGGGG